MKKILFLSSVLLLCPGAWAQFSHIGRTAAGAAPKPLPKVTSAPGDAGDEPAEKPPTPPTADEATKAMLAKIGWKAIQNGALERVAGADKGYIPENYLTEAEIEWKKGRLEFEGNDPISEEKLPDILDGLWIFVSAAKTSPEDAGNKLAKWGVPSVIDGRKIVNPDGTATYYGQMLHYLYSQKPDALKHASFERVGESLDILLEAHDQAFGSQAPHVAKKLIERVERILDDPKDSVKNGETVYTFAPHATISALLEKYKKELEADHAAHAGDAVREKDSAAALAVLKTLGSQHYDANLDLPDVPKPGHRASEGGDDEDGDGAPEHTSVRLTDGLPLLLKVLDRVNGKPLTRDQEKNLIESFPMGDLIWRLGVQDLWSRGWTGKGVKVGLIDGGIGYHDELAGAVESRNNMTEHTGHDLVDDHGTHTTGIIHAVAPDAKIDGYTVLGADGANHLLENPSDDVIINAIEKAVKAGDTIISMSLGQDGKGAPTDRIAQEIEKYKDKGVTFIVAAGNENDKNSIDAPSVAGNAITVGALTTNGRPANFSSYGANFDPRFKSLGPVVKPVYMAPGTNIYSTVMEKKGRVSSYMLMDGTSMATPAVSGVFALLTQAAAAINPVALSARVSAALTDGAAEMPRNIVPVNAPYDQKFLVVRPLASLDELHKQKAPLTAKK